MRCIRCELPDFVKRTLNSSQHCIQCFRQAAELVMRLGYFKATRQVVDADHLRGSNDLIDRSQRFPAQPISQQRRDQDERRKPFLFDQSKSIEGLVKWLGRNGRVNFEYLAVHLYRSQRDAVLIEIEICRYKLDFVFRRVWNSTPRAQQALRAE